MKRKIVIIILCISLLVAGVSIGTFAYYTSTFTSNNNVFRTAKFTVKAVNKEGNLIGDAEFNFENKPLYPGIEPFEAFYFEVDKTGTEVPVKYNIQLYKDGELFPEDSSSPVMVEIKRLVNEEWVLLEENEFIPDLDVEKFKIEVSWPHSDNDIEFQGKTGNVKIEIFATQIDDEDSNTLGEAVAELVEFKGTPNGKTFSIPNLSVAYYINENGAKVIEVSKEGNNDEDYDKWVGNFRLTEELDNQGYYLLVADGTHRTVFPYRIKFSGIDGNIVKFDGALNKHIYITCKELADWISK